MAKGALYWRHKKDGKWQYSRLNIGITAEVADEIETALQYMALQGEE